MLTTIFAGIVLAHLIKVLMKREGKSWTTTLLSVTKDGVVTPMSHTMAYSAITPILEKLSAIGKKNAVVSRDGLRQPEDRYCDAVLMLQIAEGTLGLFLDGEKRWKNIYRVLVNKGDQFWVKVTPNLVGNLVTGETMEKNRFMAWAKTHGVYVYTGEYATSSAGEMKQGVVQLPGRYYGPTNKGIAIDWADVYNQLSGGAWGIFCELCAQGEWTASFKAVAQFAMRMAQSKAPSKAFDSVLIRKYTIIPGTWQRDTVLDVNGEKFDFADGTGFVRANYLCEVINKMAGIVGKYLVKAIACVGMLLQARPWFVCKQTFLSVNDDMMSHLIKIYGTEEEVVLLAYKGLDATERKGWIDYCMSKGTKGIYAHKMVSIVFEEGFENALPDIFNDFNGQKTVFDPKYRSGMNVLNIAHLDKTTGYLSTQVLQSFLAADWENGKAMALRAALKMAVKAWKDLDPEATEGRAPSWNDFQVNTEEVLDAETGESSVEVKSINWSELANSIAPGFAKKFWTPAYRSMRDRKLKGLSTKFHKCNFEQKVIHTTILPDIGAIFAGAQVLEQNAENDVTDCYGNGSGNLSTLEYCSRIRESSTDEKGAKLAIFMARKLYRGITCVPANPEAAKAGEGWDFDGDSWYESLEFGYANRYPKTHSRGYFRISDDCVLPTPLCVDKD